MLLSFLLCLACSGDDDGPGPGFDLDAGAGDPDGGGGDGSGVPRDIDAQIVINEFMTANALSLADGEGNASDWIELYNPTSVDIPLAGYYLTDELDDVQKGGPIGDVMLPAGGHLILWPDRRPELGPTHLDFKLSREPEALGLARPDGSYIDRVRYGTQERDFSAAREPDGSDHWVIEWRVSPGAPNPSGPGQPGGTEDLSAMPEQVPAAGDLTEIIYEYDRIPELELILEADAIADLEVAPYQYVPGKLVYDGRSYGPIGVRLKGQNSFLPIGQKPSWRLNIDYYVPDARFFGLDNMTLNNMSDDFSMMHERLGYLVMREAGIPSSRVNHALVAVNGQPYGLYANVETVKKELLERWFSNPEGALFEATDVDFEAQYIADYEHEAGPDDRTLLRGLADALTAGNPDQAIARASRFVDLQQFQRFWAACSIIGQFDSFPYSLPGDDYFVYADPTTDRLHFLPWGMDEAFYAGSHHVVDNVTSVLATKCAASPACFQGYVNELWAVLDITESNIDLVGEQQRVAAQIAPHVAADRRKPYDDQTVDEYQSDLFWFIDGRRRKLSAMVPGP